MFSSGESEPSHTSFEHFVVHPSHGLASPTPSSPASNMSFEFESISLYNSSSSSASSGYGSDDDPPSPSSSTASTPTLGSPLRKSNGIGIEYPSFTSAAGRPRSTSSPSPSRKRSPQVASHPYTRSSSPPSSAPRMIRSYSMPVDTQSQLERRLSRQAFPPEVTGLLEGSAALSSAMSSPWMGLGLSMGPDSATSHPSFSNPFGPASPSTFPYNVSSECSPRRAAIQRSQSSSSVPTLHIPHFPSFIVSESTTAPLMTRPRRRTLGLMTPIIPA